VSGGSKRPRVLLARAAKSAPVRKFLSRFLPALRRASEAESPAFSDGFSVYEIRITRTLALAVLRIPRCACNRLRWLAV